jgi:hypothetical protein
LQQTSVGNKLLSQVNKLAVEKGRNVTVQFSNDEDLPSRVECGMGGNLRVIINLNKTAADRYVYLAKRKDGLLDFVSVYHPPSVVLGHELGHARQFLEKNAMTSQDLDASLAQEYHELMIPVMEEVVLLIADIDPDFATTEEFISFTEAVVDRGASTDIFDNCRKILQDRANSLLQLQEEERPRLCGLRKPSQYCKQKAEALKALEYAFTTLIIAAWNDGEFSELLNILPYSQHGLSNDTFCDGIFLKQIMNATTKLPFGDKRKPAAFTLTESVSLDPNQSNRQVTSALADPSKTLLRWSHRNTESFQIGLQSAAYTEEEFPRVTKYRDQLIYALLQQPKLCISMDQLPLLS